MKVRYFRYGLLLAVMGLVVYLALGLGTRSFEAYCPFGGAESLWGLFTSGEFSCALGPLNLSLFVALILLVLLSKKSFCGWACPVGFMGELLGRAGAVPLGRRYRPGTRLNSLLKPLRYVVLVLFLLLTYRTGELILRGYDPYYLVFSGFGHGSAGIVSYVVIGALAAGALVVPMFFCRYLCPLGATFDPFSRLGLIKVHRDEEDCTACANCHAACPHDIPVHTMTRVRARDCTNCLECLDACPEDQVLSLRASF
jgi:polyferredoxin